MFSKILIANRGEIACRVIRTAKGLGISTVAVYSEADADSLHVQEADEAYCIGPAPAQESYLNIPKIVFVAKQSGSEAIHPGYGFLSENADFCRACGENNIVFIGPDVKAIEAMGSKSGAKQLMEKAQVPLVPGYQGEDQSLELLKKEANCIGYPLLIKASAGGGGKGMRLVESESMFEQALNSAKREAQQSFGNDLVILEKYLGNARHVEVQVFCDQQGNGVYLGDRDCSMQRRHQKILEEAPAPGLSDSVRMAMGEAAVRAAIAIQYRGAGTVEFLLDPDDQFYFMEMNTRLQVEHPVTEAVTNLDLVEWQLQIAAGKVLPLQQDQIKTTGHAIEARIYAEDAENDFLPSSGKIEYLRWPEPNSNVRIDTGVKETDSISSHYDPMIAKLIVWGENREQALSRLDYSLGQCCIGGIKTNIPFLYKLQKSQAFVDASMTTAYVDNNIQSFKEHSSEQALIVKALAGLAYRLNQQQRSDTQKQSPWCFNDSWRLNLPFSQRFTLLSEGEEFDLSVTENDDGFCIVVNQQNVELRGSIDSDTLCWESGGTLKKNRFYFEGQKLTLFVDNMVCCFEPQKRGFEDGHRENTDSSVCALMHGRVTALMVEAGQEVEEGELVAVMEAMKMEHNLTAAVDGTVTDVFFETGDQVEEGVLLIRLEGEED